MKAPAKTILAVTLGAGALLPAQEPPTFRSDTQVVLLDLVARDRKGRPVADLRSDEVQVFEDGIRSDVVSFRLVRAPGRGEPAAPAQETGGSSAEAAAPSRANLVVLVFDVLPVATAPLARKSALDLLSREFPANTWFAVFKIDRSMRQLQPFTSDPARLASAVDFATTGDDARRAGPAPSLQSLDAPAAMTTPAGGPTRPDAPPNPVLAGIGGRVEGHLQELINRVSAFDSLYGLLALARSLAPVRGRKSIVYFAEAREVPDSVTVVYDTTIGEANRANVTIHTVDTRGLSAQRIGGRSAFDEVIGSFSASGGTGGGRSAIGNTQAAVATENPDTGGGPLGGGGLENPLSGSYLQHIAHDTGGLAIADTNDLSAGLGRVVEELGQYYEVVYAPPNPVPDGRFRRIEAKVSRPGVRVRTRAGYFATPAAAPGLLAYEMPLLAALGVKTPSNDFPHHAAVLHFGVKGEEREALFLAQVPLSDVRFAADEARGVYRAHLTLLGLVKDEAGRPVARFTHDWPMEGPLAERDRVRRTSTVFRRAMRLPSGRYTLETAVQDRETGALSVERSGFAITEASRGGLALGSLSIVRRAVAAAGPDAGDPLRVAGVVIHPEIGAPLLTRSMPEIPLFLPVYPSVVATAPEIRLELLRDGQPVAQARPPLPAPEPDGRIAGILGLPTKSLAPGRYEIVATVSQGDASAEERTAFEVRDAIGDSVATATPPPVPGELVPVLELAARYVLDYEQAFRDIAAEEEYTQWAERQDATVKGPTLSCTATSCRRTTRADAVFVRLGGEIPWGTFRDVFEVDGQKVRDREGRLETLFGASSSESVVRSARAILDESARYNIGPVVRNMNFPTLSLAFLHPRNQQRFAWKRGGTRRFGMVEGLEVEFEEVARPTLVDQDGRGDLPAKGRFWIDPGRGTVLRSETRFLFAGALGRASVATEYRPEPRLAMWVPAEMREEYSFRSRAEATARYSNFRKFTVAIEDEAARLPPEPPEAPPRP